MSDDPNGETAHYEPAVLCCGYQHKQSCHDHYSGNDHVINATTGDVTAMATVFFRMCLE